MKKLLIVPALFAFIFYGIYYKEVESQEIKIPTIQTTQQEINTFTNKVLNEQAELFTSNNEGILEEKKFMVTVKQDINVSKEHPITITATVKNTSNPNACNFFWREKGEIIGMGKELETSFEKGEHLISLLVKDENNHETNASIHLTAWDYHKIKNMQYNTLSQELEQMGVEVYDHKDRLILRDSSYRKLSRIFNEDNQKIEEITELYHYPQWSEIKRYTYTEDGQQNTIEVLKLNESPISFTKIIYDDEGNYSTSLRGLTEDDLVDEKEIVYGETVYSSDPLAYSTSEGTVIYSTDDTYENISTTLYNDNKQVTYTENNYGYGKEINRFEYDEKQHMIKSEKISTYEQHTEIYTIHYDDNGNHVQEEKVYKQGEEITCQYTNNATYNQGKQMLSQAHKIVDGDCSNHYVKDGYSTYEYDEKGEVSSINSSESKNSKEVFTTYSIIKTYSNILEED